MTLSKNINFTRLSCIFEDYSNPVHRLGCLMLYAQQNDDDIFTGFPFNTIIPYKY